MKIYERLVACVGAKLLCHVGKKNNGRCQDLKISKSFSGLPQTKDNQLSGPLVTYLQRTSIQISAYNRPVLSHVPINYMKVDSKSLVLNQRRNVPKARGRA